jgi:hypothetical protein
VVVLFFFFLDALVGRIFLVLHWGIWDGVFGSLLVNLFSSLSSHQRWSLALPFLICALFACVFDLRNAPIPKMLRFELSELS